MFLAMLLLPWAPIMAPQPDAPILGPDWMMVNPAGTPVWYDAALHSLNWANGPSVLVPPAEDGIFLEDGSLLLLSDRLLLHLGDEGEPKETLRLPGLAPTGRLGVEDGMVWTEDVFGNRHPVAEIGDGRLEATGAIRLVAPVLRVRSVDGRISVNGTVYAEHALGGQVVGDWLVVERRQEGVRREAIHLKTRKRVDVTGEYLIYAPTRDLAAGPDGGLWRMTPTSRGLILAEYGSQP